MLYSYIGTMSFSVHRVFLDNYDDLLESPICFLKQSNILKIYDMFIIILHEFLWEYYKILI